MGDRGKMSTDVSNCSKRIVQEMATARESLRKKVDNYHPQEQILDDLRKWQNELQNNLDESRAECEKELLRAKAAIKYASSFQSDIEALRSSVATESKENNAHKTEIASYDWKSVVELTYREKATESSMMWKAREIEAFTKQLELSFQKSVYFESKYKSLQQTTRKNNKRTESLEVSLKSEEQTCVNLKSVLKESVDELRAA